MRSLLTSQLANQFTPSTASTGNRNAFAAGARPMGFSTEIAAAAEIFANGLAEMWATRHGATTARPATAASDSRALIASLTDRAGALAARVTVPAARPGAAALKPGPFALGILADRRIRTADAVAR